MTAKRGAAIADLLSATEHGRLGVERIADGAVLLHGFAAADAPHVVAAVGRIAAAAPFRHMVTPGGYTMSVAMTNCGSAGWITDRSGYRYDRNDP